ncbi:MAG: hypothetical protein IJF71_00545, partial [Clostridia bacterium]|nr:hypothetical protein [Clostridia bacterium]
MEKICDYILAETEFPGGLYLKSAIFYRYGGKIQLHFQTKGVVTALQKETISAVLEKKLPRYVKEFSFELSRIYFDEEIVQKCIQGYLSSKEPAISAGTDYATVRLEKKEDTFYLSLAVDDMLKESVLSGGVIERLSAFLTDEYKEPFRVTPRFVEKEIEANTEIYAEAANQRKIKVTGIKEVIGKPIFGDAMYICDVEEESPSVVLCGTITRMKRFDPEEPKEGERKRSTFFRIRLKDFTGEISCAYYAAQSRIPLVEKLYSEENGGAQVICSGKTVLNSKGSLELRISNISLCTLPESFTIMPMPEKPEPPTYTKIIPQPYQETVQEGMFSFTDLSVPTMLQNKTVVVFDTETTGIEFDLHKVAEIGAVKIENGIITSTFHTLINPERRMPKEAQSV